jgi:hypothetical protein
MTGQTLVLDGGGLISFGVRKGGPGKERTGN